MKKVKFIVQESILENELVEPPSTENEFAILTRRNVQNANFPELGEKSLKFISQYFPEVTAKEWNDWHWQIRNSYTSLQSLTSILKLSSEEMKVFKSKTNLPVRITPYYASLLSSFDSKQPLRRSVVPVFNELIISKGEENDPLGEHGDTTVSCIVHRYPDRVLFLVTDFCSTYCRYCTRSHTVAKTQSHHAMKSEWDLALEYISNHPEIRDVLISGGDPLTLSDSQLEYLLSKIRQIEHVEIIRLGSKVPAVLPQRITTKLVNMLKKYHPLFLSLHFTHPDELTEETKFACRRLADAGIPMGSQTVLLKDINDDAQVYKKLAHELLKVRVRPYYLYQCDPIPGSAHFRTPVEKGLEIIQNMRGHTSGYAVPHYVIDAPGGGGKIPLLPNYYQGKDEDGNVVLKNYEGGLYNYPDY
ncbi:MAG: KamA family radical SAM protein [Bacteroidales bacterium]|nr:KamA family radical SAM protein [Bacteroidales bacterium]